MPRRKLQKSLPHTRGDDSSIEVIDTSDIRIGAAYIRVSTHEQDEYSPESQIRVIREYASKNAIVIPDEFLFRDDGISGRSAAKRPNFLRMISLAKTKPAPFDVILVWKFSRFARNEEESIVYKSLLRRDCHVDVVSISEPTPDGPFGGLVERIIEWMDAFYSVRLSGEVKRGMTEKVLRGEAVSIPAFGYDIIDKTYVPNADAPMVRQIFTDYVSGVGQREIAVRLNALGYRTRRGNPFENRTVSYILQNPVYIGKIRWNPAGRTRRNFSDANLMIVQGTHEPIISEELFQAAQVRLAEVAAAFAPHARSSGITFMLQGLVKCSSCGAGLSRAHSDALQCIKYAKGVCKTSHYVHIPELSAAFVSAVTMDLATEKFTVVHKTTRSKADLTLLRAQLERERRKLARIRESYTAGVDTLDEYRTYKKTITKTISDLEAKIASEAQQPFDARAFANRVSSAMAEIARTDLSEQEKNSIIRTFVDHIVFEREKRDLHLDVVYYD